MLGEEREKKSLVEPGTSVMLSGARLLWGARSEASLLDP